jgi:hypothetical protein
MGILTDNCSYLQVQPPVYQLGLSSCQLGTPILLSASVQCVASVQPENPPCGRAGSVDFQWVGINTAGMTMGADLTPGGVAVSTALGPNVVPGGPPGGVLYVWTPSAAQVGAIPANECAVGKVYAYASSNFTICQGNCDPLSPSDVPAVTASTPTFNILPPPGAAPGPLLAVRAIRAERQREVMLGFGVRPDPESRVRARAMQTEGFLDFVTPEFGIAVVRGPKVRGEYGYFSGVLLQEDVPKGKYPSDAKVVAQDEVQGVLQIVWPAGSDGKRTLLEVWQETDEGVIGRFVIGLSNVPPDDPRFVWA